MTRQDINEAIESYCQQCHGPGIGCINQRCPLWSCRTVTLAKEISIEDISDGVMFFCRSCLEYQGHCDADCQLSEIPT